MPTSNTPNPDEVLFTLNEVCERYSVHAQIIIEMVEYGIVTPVNRQSSNHSWQFSMDALARLSRAQRLRRDLELDLSGVALSLDLLDQIDILQQEVNSLKHQLKKLNDN